MKKVIKLTENDLHKIIIESVKMAINEIGDTDEGQYDLGRAAARRYMRSVNSNDLDDFISHGDYEERIKNHAAANCSSLEQGKNFDMGFDDVINYYKKNKKQ